MQHPTTSGYVPVNGLSMYYEIYGEGAVPLVMIHGGGSTIESSFGNLLPLLSPAHPIIAVELQAHGRTADRAAPESFQQDADDVAELLTQLKVGRAHILGFSNGGSTAMQLAIRHPRVVGKIIVIAGIYARSGFVPGFFESMDGATIDHLPGPLRGAYLKVNPDEAGLRAMFEKDKARMISFKDWPAGDLRAIKAPALLISGDKDVIMPEHTVEMAKLIPGAQMAILPGVHGACIGEVCAVKEGSKLPEMTAMLINDFLGE